MFNKLYKHYKNTFDIEMLMTNAHIGYEKLQEKMMSEEEWF